MHPPEARVDRIVQELESIGDASCGAAGLSDAHCELKESSHALQTAWPERPVRLRALPRHNDFRRKRGHVEPDWPASAGRGGSIGEDCARCRRQFHRHRQYICYICRRRERAHLGPALKNLGVPRDDVVIATKVLGPMGEGPNARGASRRHVLAQARRACNGSGSTISTCTKSMASMQRRPSSRLWKRWIRSSAKAMSATLAFQLGGVAGDEGDWRNAERAGSRQPCRCKPIIRWSAAISNARSRRC